MGRRESKPIKLLVRRFFRLQQLLEVFAVKGIRLAAPLILIWQTVVANGFVEKDVKLTVANCADGVCIEMAFNNDDKLGRPICIRNAVFPFEGALQESAFKVENASTGQVAPYLKIEPSVLSPSRHAVLVRLLPSGATAISSILLSDEYGIDPDESYRINYTARAYFCDQFGDEEEFFFLTGRAVYAPKN